MACEVGSRQPLSFKTVACVQSTAIVHAVAASSHFIVLSPCGVPVRHHVVTLWCSCVSPCCHPEMFLCVTVLSPVVFLCVTMLSPCGVPVCHHVVTLWCSCVSPCCHPVVFLCVTMVSPCGVPVRHHGVTPRCYCASPCCHPVVFLYVSDVYH